MSKKSSKIQIQPLTKKPTVKSFTEYGWKGLALTSLVGLVAIFGYLIQPVPYRYVVPQADGRLLEATKSTKGARIVLGASTHVLPLIQVINALGDPFKKWLVPFDTQALRIMAMDRIGHDNFGDLTDWEAFDKFVEVADNRCHLFGRFAIRGMLEMILATNLKIQQLLLEHPEIENETIEKPVILAAFTRTGATFLYQVLADIFREELTPTYSYEIFGGPLELSELPQRQQIAEDALNGLGAINPPMKMLHEWIAADEPEDEPGWYQFSLMGLVIPFTLPTEWHHAKLYEPASQVLNRRLWETLNKIRQWQASKKQRFLMKAPEHLFGFPDLVKAHPDASFVTVSRDEESWYPSSLVMTQLFQHMFVDAQVEDSIAFTDRLLCGQRKALQVALHGSYEVLPVKFGSYLFTQTIDVVEKIAKHADLPWDDAAQARAKAVIAKRLSWKKGKAYYDLDAFGLTNETIAKRIATICDNLPLVE